MLRIVLQSVALAGLLLGLPLLGAVLAGHPASRYLEFPPLTQYVPHAPFSWAALTVFSLLGLLAAWAIIPLYFPCRRAGSGERTSHRFPPWGWFSLLAMLSFWVLAWTRFDWFKPMQSFTFTLLWLAYILFANAVAYWRTGYCYATHRRRELAALFPASAVFWWYFEYLNRFVQNWHYIGIDGYGPIRYASQATLAFSTVIPAVMSTLEMLKTLPCLSRIRYRPSIAIRISRRHAWALLILSALGLAGIAAWPDWLFPAIWLLPMLILLSLPTLFNHEEPLSGSGLGDWHLATLAMLAALLCGFLWEMWNYFSIPKWIYSVPFVNRFHLFEMPLLGYLGYLPFGLTCLLVADRVARMACRGVVATDRHPG